MTPDHSDDLSDSDGTGDAWGLSRRGFVAANALAAAGVGTAGAGTAVGQESGGEDGVSNTVAVSACTGREPAVSDQLFGRLAEHYCSGTIYPGVYSQHVKNPSFYPRTWSEDDHFGPKTFFDPASIERHEEVPFPWEPIDGDGVGFEQREGGVAAVDTTGYQRVSLSDATGGIAQKIVLPDFRTLGYDLSFSVRGDVDAVTVAVSALNEPTEDSFEVGETLATSDVDVAGDWERHEVTLALDEAAGDEYVAGSVGNVDTPYGEYRIEFTAEGSGHVDLDWITLAADDAVNGKFNPSTVELMRERNCTWLKWPGGNVTSQYDWRDGVGPLDERPVRFNHAWGGIEPNYFGTDEYLELCEIADLTPRITIGWWDNPPEWAAERQILPEDAADWVEYCNGSAGTEMGRLRKENGHPPKYDVQYWEVGNEVWGPWQRGHTADPSEYASGSDERIGFNEYYDAMLAVDDSITVLADGMDPGYDEAETPDPADWNETLFAESGDRLDGLDLHRYNWGIEDQDARDAWYEANDADAIDYNEVLVMFPTQFGVLMEELGEKATEAGIDDFRINVGEYGLFPSVDDGAPYPGPETMPGGAYVAGMLNAFVRQSEHVVEASQTWLPVRMFPPEFSESPSDPNPQAPAAAALGLYSELFEDGAEWRAARVDVSGTGRTIPETGPRIGRMADVPFVDAAAMHSERAETLAAFLVNRNLRTDSEVTLELGDRYAGATVSVTRLRAAADERPLPHRFQDSWEEPDAYDVVETDETVADDGALTTTLGPATVLRAVVEPTDGPGRSDDGPAPGRPTGE